MRLSFAAVTVIVALSPTSALAGFKCPAQGGSGWREYRSKHFVVRTDAGSVKVGLLVARLESMHALELQALLGEQVDIPGRLQVIAFADPSLFTQLAGKDYIGGYYKSSTFGEPTIVLPLEGLDAVPESVAHEVAHHLSTFVFVRQPAWFHVGLAYFVQTIASVAMRFEPALGSHLVRGQRDHGASAGAVPFSLAAGMSEAPRVSFAELWEWNGREERQGGSYHLYSWLLYHWLWNTRSKDFTAFQQRLSNGDDPKEAWRASFPDLDPANAGASAKVDDALEGYRRGGRYVSYPVEAKSEASFETLGPIASADVHMLLRDVALSWSGPEHAANVAEALREDDSQPTAILVRAEADKKSPLDPLRKAVTARPGDWRAWFALAAALGDSADDQKEAAYRKAISLNPDAARAHNDFAWFLATRHRAKEALPIANRALDLSPASPAYMDTLAVVAADLGKCAEALVLERRAAGMVPTESEFAAKFAKRIAEWQARCGNPAPAAASVAPTPGR